MTMKTKRYTVGIGSIQPYMTKDIYTTGARRARWAYVNLYAPPGTKYYDTWCNGVRLTRRNSEV